MNKIQAFTLAITIGIIAILLAVATTFPYDHAPYPPNATSGQFWPIKRLIEMVMLPVWQAQPAAVYPHEAGSGTGRNHLGKSY